MTDLKSGFLRTETFTVGLFLWAPSRQCGEEFIFSTQLAWTYWIWLLLMTSTRWLQTFVNITINHTLLNHVVSNLFWNTLCCYGRIRWSHLGWAEVSSLIVKIKLPLMQCHETIENKAMAFSDMFRHGDWVSSQGKIHSQKETWIHSRNSLDK